jgi:hypothetical protein
MLIATLSAVQGMSGQGHTNDRNVILRKGLVISFSIFKQCNTLLPCLQLPSNQSHVALRRIDTFRTGLCSGSVLESRLPNIRGVPGLNLGRVTGYPYIFSGFSQSLHLNVGIVPWHRPRTPPPDFLPVYTSRSDQAPQLIKFYRVHILTIYFPKITFRWT